MHVVWVAQTKPPPAWLHIGTPIENWKTQGQRHRMRYYRKIYQATPPWSKRAEVAAIYKRAAEMRAQGFNVEVDHMVPLNHDHVCGLHCPDNLQIIGKIPNSKKSNNYWPDMWRNQEDLFSQPLEPDQLFLF